MLRRNWRRRLPRSAAKDELREGLSDLRDELRCHMDVSADRIHDNATHHVGRRKTYEELRDYWREYVKTHAKEPAKSRRSIEKLTGRVEKLGTKATRKRLVS